MFKNLKILKFGGHSIADANCISFVVDILQSKHKESNLVVVLSAFKNVTNELMSLAELASKGKNIVLDFDSLIQRHTNIIEELCLDNCNEIG